jgi:hypothetical protein
MRVICPIACYVSWPAQGSEAIVRSPGADGTTDMDVTQRIITVDGDLSHGYLESKNN